MVSHNLRPFPFSTSLASGLQVVIALSARTSALHRMTARSVPVPDVDRSNGGRPIEWPLQPSPLNPMAAGMHRTGLSVDAGGRWNA